MNQRGDDPARPPSGAQHEIGRGTQRAVVCEVGATLRSYAIDGLEMLDGFSAGERSSAGRGEVLAPWPNRLDGGRYAFEGARGQAALDEPEHGNAIHGLVRWLPWGELRGAEDAITLGCTLFPQPAYPWQVELAIEYRLGDEGLTVTTTATNRSAAAAPFGIGFHPYLSVGTAVVNDAAIVIPAARRLLADGRGLPVGDEVVDGTPFDFRAARAIGETVLDTAFTDLARGPDGRARVTLADVGGARAITLWVDAAYRYLMVYTGDTLEPESRRRRGVAVEPMTCPPNAFRTGRQVIRLEPERPWTASWGIEGGEVAAR